MMEEGLLDPQLTQTPDELRTHPVVRVLTGAWLREVFVWSVIGFCTLAAPLLVGPDTVPTLMLVLLLNGVVFIVIGYGVLVWTPAKDEPRHVKLLAVQSGLLLMTVATAVTLHPVAATCFVLSLWCSGLVVLMRLIHTPDELAPPKELAFSMLGATLAVSFVCVIQELSLADVAVNALAVVLAIVCNAFRWDWLAHHALASESAYNLKEIDIAWNHMYTWTVRHRLIERFRSQSGT